MKIFVLCTFSTTETCSIDAHGINDIEYACLCLPYCILFHHRIMFVISRLYIHFGTFAHIVRIKPKMHNEVHLRCKTHHMHISK